jgi:hypothetical protein
MRRVLRVLDEKSARALANPLHEPVVAGAFEQRLDAVERIADAAARDARLGPFVNHRGREFEVGGDVLGFSFFQNLAHEFVGMHGLKMVRRGKVCKREAITNFGRNCNEGIIRD